MSYVKPPYPVDKGGTGATTQSGARTNLSVPAIADVMLLDGTQAMTDDLDVGGNKLINVATPSANSDGVNKSYVDGLVVGLTDYKESCRVATTGNVATLAGGAPDTVDGVTLASGNRILVKDQSTGSQNGIYTVTTLGTGSNGTWTRATDFDASAEVTTGAYTYIEEGSVNAGRGYRLSTSGAITLGTTSLTFTIFAGGTTIVAGDGLTLTGSTLDIGAGTGIQVNADTIQIDPAWTGQNTITTLGTITTGVWNGTDVPVTAGGTGASTAGDARTNLSAAPNTAGYWVKTDHSELSNDVVPSGGSGITVNASAGTISIDSTVATLTGSQTLTNKTLTTPKITYAQRVETDNYTVVATDSHILMNVATQKTVSLLALASATGQEFTIKNLVSSSANVIVDPDSSETIDGVSTHTLAPGDSITVFASTSNGWVII